MSRITPLWRASSAVALGAAAAAVLTGCFGPGPVPPVETPKPTATGFATIGDDPQPIDTGTPIEPEPPATSGYTSVLDDLGVLTVQVPDTWTDVDGSPFTSDTGQQWASIKVAEDIDGYYQSWGVSGAELGATAVQGVTDDVLQGFLTSITAGYDDCDTVAQEAAPYDDGFFDGFQSAYEGCGESTSAFAIVAANGDRTQVVFVLAQVSADYDANEVYLAIANSFDTSIGRAVGKN